EQPAPGKADTSLVDGNVLRNEFLEALIGADTGALRAFRDFRVRGTLLSQQLARRWPGPRTRPGEVWRDPDETAIYSVMAADEIEVLARGPVFGEIQTRGRLMHLEGAVAARFAQTFHVERGSRLVKIAIEIEPIDL